MPYKRGNFLAIIDRPQLECSVIAAGHRTHSVARESGGIDRLRMSPQLVDQTTIRNIPENGCTIAAT